MGNPAQADHTGVVIGFASTNPHKLREMQETATMLAPAIRVVAYVPPYPVAETGETFCDNAMLKLNACLAHPIPQEITHLMAEDSGLIVDALAGQYGLEPFPGIASDRWFTSAVQQDVLGQVFDNPTYQEKNQGILTLMTGQSQRSARYEACLVCWCRAGGDILQTSGTVTLAVSDAPSGENGFGYDPIMIPVAYDPTRTMAQLSPVEKNRISHRFQALAHLLPLLLQQST